MSKHISLYDMGFNYCCSNGHKYHISEVEYMSMTISEFKRYKCNICGQEELARINKENEEKLISQDGVKDNTFE